MGNSMARILMGPFLRDDYDAAEAVTFWGCNERIHSHHWENGCHGKTTILRETEEHRKRLEPGAYIFVVVASYLLGSVPSGYLAGKGRGIDVREQGSGNIGATNVLRVLGTRAGVAVLACDALKGFAAARWTPALALHFFPAPGASPACLTLLSGTVSILAHNYPCWLRFKGGKGIATSAGVVLAWAPAACLSALALWGLVFAVSRYVSLASIAAALVLPFAVWYWKGGAAMTTVMTVLSLMAIYRHKANIRRLLDGTEARFVKKKT
jgi:acyl phosphate:glycerol-3-phosphate acyltransferase